jgi:hypothetical protein
MVRPSGCRAPAAWWEIGLYLRFAGLILGRLRIAIIHFLVVDYRDDSPSSSMPPLQLTPCRRAIALGFDGGILGPSRVPAGSLRVCLGSGSQMLGRLGQLLVITTPPPSSMGVSGFLSRVTFGFGVSLLPRSCCPARRQSAAALEFGGFFYSGFFCCLRHRPLEQLLDFNPTTRQRGSHSTKSLILAGLAIYGLERREDGWHGRL